MGLSCDGHAPHELGSILFSWKCMTCVDVLELISWHTWWKYWHRCWCTIYDKHGINIGDFFYIDNGDYIDILYDAFGIDHSDYLGIVHGYVVAYVSSLGMFNVLEVYMM